MKKIIILFLVWRIMLFGFAKISPQVIKNYGNQFPYYQNLTEKNHLPQWVRAFGSFDGVYYLRIAKWGYQDNFSQAFFPIFPIFINIFSKITTINLLLSGLIISNLSFLAALLLFFTLVKEKFNEKTALWSSLFLTFWPTSFYFGAVYTESLFLLLLLLAFYFEEKNKTLLSSIIGLFASATRIVGVLLSITLSKMKNKAIMPLFIVPLGLLTYMLYLKVRFNNPLYFISSQAAFGQGRSTHLILLPQVYYRSVLQIMTTHGLVLFNSTQDFFAVSVCIAILIASWKLVPKNWVIFSLIAVLVPTFSGSFISMPRYVLIAFPMYIFLGTIKNTFVKTALLLLCICLLSLNTILFTRGYWVA